METVSKMNENNMPLTHEACILTSVPQSSHTTDIIDLTEINDGDEYEVISSSIITSNNSLCAQQPEIRSDKHRRRDNSSGDGDNLSSKTQSGSADDSICILYENIQPKPDIVVVNEVIIDNNAENEPDNYNSLPIPIPPLIMGAYNETLDSEPITPIFPEVSVERTDDSSQPINYSLNVQLRTSQPSSVSSCIYTTINERSYSPISVGTHTVGFQRSPQSTTEVPLNLKTVPGTPLNYVSCIEKPDTIAKVPKIQCGICLDGPDEIAASERNFTSTNCGHVFCNICIKISIKNAAKCPKCRKKITSRSIHPLYL